MWQHFRFHAPSEWFSAVLSQLGFRSSRTCNGKETESEHSLASLWCSCWSTGPAPIAIKAPTSGVGNYIRGEIPGDVQVWSTVSENYEAVMPVRRRSNPIALKLLFLPDSAWAAPVVAGTFQAPILLFRKWISSEPQKVLSKKYKQAYLFKMDLTSLCLSRDFIWRELFKFKVLLSVSEEVADVPAGLLTAAHSCSAHELPSGCLFLSSLLFLSSCYILTSHTAIIPNHAEDTFIHSLWLSTC